MASVFLSIGSNIDRKTNICSCMRQLRQDFGEVTFSQIYETPAEGFEGEPFLNLVAGFSTNLPLDTVRGYLRELEDFHGRIRNGEKFSARTLDVDLLLYDDMNLQPGQNLPHNDILRYPFVLFPLAEISPDLIHPALGQSLSSLAAQSILPKNTLKPVDLGCLQG